MKINKRNPETYIRPMIIEYVVQSEGVLCASGAHDSLTEDDEWADLLE